MSKANGRPFVGHSPRCEGCGRTESKIIDKRVRENDVRGDIYRRRECLYCGTRFSTWEVGGDSYDIIKDGRRWFNQAKALLFRWRKFGFNRFDCLERLDRPQQIARMWNDSIFIQGVEYGARLALIQLFGFNERENDE